MDREHSDRFDDLEKRIKALEDRLMPKHLVELDGPAASATAKLGEMYADYEAQVHAPISAPPAIERLKPEGSDA